MPLGRALRLATAQTDGFTMGAVDESAHTTLVTMNGSWSSVRGDEAYLFVGFEWGLSTASDFTAEGPLAVTTSFFGEEKDLTGEIAGSNSFTVGSVQTSKGFQTATALASDTTYTFRAKQNSYTEAKVFVREHDGRIVTVKTDAVAVTSSTPSASSIAATTATISCSFFPNCVASAATSVMQYRVRDSTRRWTDATTTTSASTGYSAATSSAAITGLSAETNYEIRCIVTRTTNNANEFTSVSGYFTTIAGVPTVTTAPTTEVTWNSAILHGDVTPNDVLTRVRFGWQELTDAGAGVWSNYTPYEELATTRRAFNAKIGDGINILPTQTYYYRALLEYPSPGYATVIQSSSLLFVADNEPTAAGATAGCAPGLYQFDAKYGVASTFYFSIMKPIFASTPINSSQDRFANSLVSELFADGDITISKDGGNFATISASTPTQVQAAEALYSITLTATEMQATQIAVLIKDLTSTPLYRDALILIRTKMLLGQIDVDATQIGSNTPALSVVGVGTSPGILATGGSTSSGDITGSFHTNTLRSATAQASTSTTIKLDASASTSDDYYNGSTVMLWSGTGAGQFRVITDYVGATLVATVNRAWTTTPSTDTKFFILAGDETWDIPSGAEVSKLPTKRGKIAKLLQFVWQQFAYKYIQTHALITTYKADSSTILATGTYSADNQTQDHGKLS